MAGNRKYAQDDMKGMPRKIPHPDLAKKDDSSSASSTLFAPNSSLFIKNLRPDMSLSEFIKAFSGFSPAKHRLTFTDTEKFGFLEFKTHKDAKFCMNSMNSRLVLGHKIEIHELEQSHQQYFELEQVIEDKNDSRSQRYSSMHGGRKTYSRSDYRGHSPKSNYRGQSDTFRGSIRISSRSRSPRNLSSRDRRMMSPRSPPPMKYSPSSRSRSPRNRSNSRGRSRFPRRSISPLARHDHKRVRPLSPGVEIIERKGPSCNTGRNDHISRPLSSYLQDTRSDDRRLSHSKEFTREFDARDDYRPRNDRLYNDNRATAAVDSKKTSEISDWNDYLKSHGHKRQESDTITLPLSYSTTAPQTAHNIQENSRAHSAEDMEEAFKISTPSSLGTKNRSFSDVQSLLDPATYLVRNTPPIQKKSDYDPILEALNELPLEKSSSRQYQLQSDLIDLNTEFSNLGNELQKQQEIEKNAKQKQLIIAGRRAEVRNAINRIQSELFGLKNGYADNTARKMSTPQSKQLLLDLTNDFSAPPNNFDPSVSVPNATLSVPVPEPISSGNSEVEEEIATGIAPKMSEPIKQAPSKTTSRNRSSKRSAATITSNTRAVDPSTVLPRGESRSPSPKRAAVAHPTNDISFTSSQIEFKVFTDDRRQILKDYETTKIGKTNFKPRSLVLYPSCYKARHSVIGMTPYSRTGEGIQLWNLEKKERLQAISAAELQIPQGYCEEVEWIERDCIAVAPVYKNDNPAKYQLGLLRDCRMNSKTNAFEYDFLPLKKMPHQKGITSIIPVFGSTIYSPVQFATGGLDHKVVLWKTDDITRSDPRFTTTMLKVVHTSAISALLFNRTYNRIYSGGKDMKIFGMDVETQDVVFGNPDKRHANQIQELMGIANHPDLLLAGIHKSKFLVYDVRQSITKPVNQIERNMSQGFYHRASIHNNGMMLSAGNDEGSIELWDLRYVKGCTNPQTLTIHSKTVVAAKFYNDELLSVSSDWTFCSTTWT